MFLSRHRTTPHGQSRGLRPRTTAVVVAGMALTAALVAAPAIAGSVGVSPSAGATAAVVGPASISSTSGRLLASNCYQCHGTYGTGGFERLSGESATELYGELKEFAASTSSNNIMAAHAAGYTDAQLRAISVYLSTAGR